MKATFFSVVALAVSAIAFPLVEKRQVAGAVNEVQDIVIDDLGVGQIVGDATGNPSRRDITNAAGLVGSLTTLLADMKDNTGAINSTLAAFKDGKLTKAAATSSASKDLAAMHFKLTTIITELTSAAGIPVSGADVDVVLTLVVALVAEILATVKSLVTILGLQVQLTTLLNAVFVLLAKVLTLVLGLVTGILPGLVAALSPLLAALGTGLLAPLLTPIVALVAGLAAA